ncbi:MAG: WGR domain-containing protein, partial [Myxococcota bacterium]
MHERYEFRDKKSAKFWSFTVEGATVTTQWGRIGTDGQTKSRDYADHQAALADAKKAAASKTKKCYQRVESDAEPP